MTSTSSAGPTSPDGKRSSYRSLLRCRTDRVVGGVAAGLAEHLGLDPLWVRLAFVLATVWSGVGAVVYLVLWWLLPEGDGVEDVLAQRLERGEISAEEYRQILADVRATPGARRPR